MFRQRGVGVTCPPALGRFLPPMHFRDSSVAVASMTVQIRPFARYAELLGTEVITLELGDAATVGDAIAVLRRLVPNADQLPERPLAAIALEHVGPERVLHEGDEVALLPPLAGG